MANTERLCIARKQTEPSDVWYYRDTDHGLEYLCADVYATLPDQERMAWRLLPDNAM